MDKKKSILILGMFGIIFMFFGGSLAYWTWTTSSEQQTNVVFTVTKDFECAVDGGGNITSADVELVPTDCTNSAYAIKREVTVTPTVYDTELSVYMDLWLDVNSLGTGLSNSTNFSYALTTSETSCTEGVISKGNFNGKTANDTVKILGKSYSASTTETYWLYIWLDSAETSSSTMNQTFDLSLNGSCTNDPYVPPEAPALDEGMIPVTISNDGTVTTISETDEDWYDYSNKEWANVVLVDSDSRSSYLGTTGKTVSSDDILAYYVWIPRYKYRIPEMKCSDLENPTIVNYQECYELPYTMSENDKNGLITWWQEYYIEITSDSTYTTEQATSDINDALETGVFKIIVNGELNNTIPIGAFVTIYNDETSSNATYNETFNGNNVLIGPRSIDIVFESASSTKSTGDAVNTYYTHPAFTFGSSEVSGIWVGKFETSADSSSECYISPSQTTCNNTEQSPRILPNVKSLGWQSISNQFRTSLKFSGGILNTSTGEITFSGNNTYGLTNNTDSHQMKNSEWGAVTYLSHSKYGINGEIRINNNNNKITGCGGADNNNGNYTSTCEIAYGSGVTEYPQSTTGNISGIFDMSGGADEYVMGIYSDSNKNPRSGWETTNNNYSGFNGLLYNDTEYTSGVSFPQNKYYDLYLQEQFTGDESDTSSYMSLCTLETCGGHALYEIATWYDDNNSFVSKTIPFFLRGGYYNGGNMFDSSAYSGRYLALYGFRSVLISE